MTATTNIASITVTPHHVKECVMLPSSNPVLKACYNSVPAVTPQRKLEELGHLQFETCNVRGRMVPCVRLLKDWRPLAAAADEPGEGGEGAGVRVCRGDLRRRGTHTAACWGAAGLGVAFWTVQAGLLVLLQAYHCEQVRVCLHGWQHSML